MSLDCYRLGAGFWSPMLCQEVHHQEGRTQRSAVMLLVVSSRGQIGVNAHTLRWSHGAAIPMNSGLQGQVGQESNLQPAVLEHSARCPESSRVV